MTQTAEMPMQKGHARKPRTKRPTQNGIVCWHGMTVGQLTRFLSVRPPLHWSRGLRIASLFPVSVMNSLLSAVESTLYSRRVRETPIDQPPVFILGHWRSGTTLLHNLFARDARFTYANLYHVLCPNHFLLTESVATRLTAPLLPKTRPMDNMPCGWDLPQEDETALCLFHLLSPYLMLVFHGEHEVFDRYFDLSDLSEAELQTWKQTFLLLMKKLTLRQPKPIVLKSPTHTYRIPLLLEMFPEAKFIYIVRDPYAVFHSTMHLRRTLFETNGLRPLNDQGMDEDVLRTYEQLFRAYERDRGLIPPERLYEVRYEEFEVDPLGELRKIYEQLDLFDFEPLHELLKPEAEQLRKFQKNRYDWEESMKLRIYDRLRPAFEQYGYGSRLTGDHEVLAEPLASAGRLPRGSAFHSGGGVVSGSGALQMAPAASAPPSDGQ